MTAPTIGAVLDIEALPLPPHDTAPTWADGWAARGLCLVENPEVMYGESSAQREARAICRRCPVVIECLAEALDEEPQLGVWGGTTERERRRLKRMYPQIESWKDFFRERADDLGGTGRPTPAASPSRRR